jgi:hypothetical protein
MKGHGSLKNHFLRGHQKRPLNGSLQADGVSFLLFVLPKQMTVSSVVTCQTAMTPTSFSVNAVAVYYFCNLYASDTYYCDTNRVQVLAGPR